MKRLENYKAGVNLGHWLAQSGDKGCKEYFESFIQESDIARIASWGMDHIRVPVDYHLFENDNNPGVYDEEGLSYIDKCLKWCKVYGLNMILDLHEAPGYSFFNANESERAEAFTGDKSNTMFSDERLKERFINIWKMFAQRYQQEGKNLVFELLNEIVLEDIGQWNALWQETVKEIRVIDSERTILIGGNNNSDVADLRHLAITDDPGVVYTFHFYEPGMFTHQRAPFISYLANYTVPVTYPHTRSEHKEFFDFFEEKGMMTPEYEREVFGKDFLRDLLKPAEEFMRTTGKELLCGEFGVNEYADYDSTVRWYQDFVDLLGELGIGHTTWSYVGFSTFMSDEPREVRYPEIVKIISQK